MKIKWLVADATAVRSLDRAERASVVLANASRIYGQGATLSCRNPLLSSNKFTQGRLMKIEWLVADVTAAGCLERAKHAILG